MNVMNESREGKEEEEVEAGDVGDTILLLDVTQQDYGPGTDCTDCTDSGWMHLPMGERGWCSQTGSV